MKELALMLAVAIPVSLQSQLCQGSLGDPVARISYGHGPNPGPRLSSQSTTYTYASGDCPNDGEYTLINRTFNCFGGTWHTLVVDHTADDLDGYMMLVNASFQPGDFFVDTIRGLCGNTTYELSAWVVNMLKPAACNRNGIDPNLTFQIESTSGVVLATYNSGNIPETDQPVWRQYGVFFKTPPANTDVVIRITNHAPGGCGNDLALDDISFRPCGPQVQASIGGGVQKMEVCEGQDNSVLISSTYSAGYATPAFQWQQSDDQGVTWSDISGATSSSYFRPNNPSTGSFLYRMVIAESSNFNSPRCRVATNTVEIKVVPLPFVQATNYVFGCFGSDVALFASGGSNYVWTGPNGFSSTRQDPVVPKIKFTDAGVYRVTVSSEGLCTSSDSTNLVVYPAANASTGQDVSLCEGVGAQLYADGGLKYKWTPSNGLSNDSIATPLANPADSTTYVVWVTNEYGCIDTASVRVNIWKKPEAHAGPDKKTRVGRPVILSGSALGTNVNATWWPSTSLSSPNILTPEATPDQDTYYVLRVQSSLGCGQSTDTVFVKVFQKTTIPNVFSPNGDGINDTWVIEPLELFEESNTQVFNRYGKLVYQSKGYPKPWDGTANGKPLPTGTYYYVIDFRLEDEPRAVGSVTILR